MTVPVHWYNAYPETVDPGATWDLQMLRDLFDHSMWRPVAAHYFEDRPPEDGEGAVVIVPGRYHDRPGDITALNEALRPLPWCLLIVTSDEANQFPVEFVSHPRMKVWVQTPNPARGAHRDAFPFGVGYAPQTRHMLATEGAPQAELRPLDAWFAGQVTHLRRSQCIDGLRNCWDHEVDFIETEGFTQGVDHETYARLLASCKVAPCPSGPITPDTFRLWEALEAGCVPLADAFAPADNTREGYWDWVAPGAPFPQVHRWSELPEMLRQVVDHDNWPAVANRVGAWWEGYKRDLAYRLRDDVSALMGEGWREGAGDAVTNMVTAVVVASPIPSHPSSAVLDETLASIREHLPGVEILVLFDGVRREQEHRRDAYEEHQRAFQWQSRFHRHNVLPVRFERHTHQAGMLRAALPMVKTPLLLFMEADTPLSPAETLPIDWAGCCRVILGGHADVVRFHHEASIPRSHRSLMLDGAPHMVDGVPLIRTAQWSQRPHLASVAYYRGVLSQHFSEDARTMIEDVMHGVVQEAWHVDGEQGWYRHRVCIYAPDGSMVRSRHLDGREGDPKYGMTNFGREL